MLGKFSFTKNNPEKKSQIARTKEKITNNKKQITKENIK
jgi:hypothetical protein